MTKDEIKSKIKTPSVRKRLYSDDHLARYDISFYVGTNDSKEIDKFIKEFIKEDF